MKISNLGLGVKLFEMDFHPDERGYFSEIFNGQIQKELNVKFVAENQSGSRPGVIRGLHSQSPPQAKLVRCAAGVIVDVIADPFKKQHISVRLTDPSAWIYIPEHLYHGFVALTDAIVHYKVTRKYNPKGQLTMPYDHPDFNIPWKSWFPEEKFILSDKDRKFIR
jgi:dTDP-4-dehydrorhamnose 3,5-epimerase